MSAAKKRVKRQTLIKRSGAKCFYCERKIRPAELTLDHVVPKALGGSNRLDNLRLACRPCNQKKADMPPHIFIGLVMIGEIRV